MHSLGMLNTEVVGAGGLGICKGVSLGCHQGMRGRQDCMRACDHVSGWCHAMSHGISALLLYAAGNLLFNMKLVSH